ncbi:hypothetical protein RV13_GL001863 [Enterococcus raffinosus]|nr:hypothetical protein RV13_GL001863 [Enterococcus raffinosus]
MNIHLSSSNPENVWLILSKNKYNFIVFQYFSSHHSLNRKRTLLEALLASDKVQHSDYFSATV